MNKKIKRDYVAIMPHHKNYTNPPKQQEFIEYYNYPNIAFWLILGFLGAILFIW